MKRYLYTECGLDNVQIEGMQPLIDDVGEEVYCVPNVTGLHKVIAYDIITREVAMSGEELRFLRTEMGLTQAELAQLVHFDGQTVGRWERGETSLDQTAEVVIRLLVFEKLELGSYDSVEHVAKRCVPTATIQIIRIDGSDPKNYKIAA